MTGDFLLNRELSAGVYSPMMNVSCAAMLWVNPALYAFARTVVGPSILMGRS